MTTPQTAAQINGPQCGEVQIMADPLAPCANCLHSERPLGQPPCRDCAELWPSKPESKFAPKHQPKPAKPRRKPYPATAKSMKHLEAEGWTCCKVEQRIPRCFITRD